MSKQHTTKETAALEILKSTGVDIIDAAMIAREVMEANRGKVKRARRVTIHRPLWRILQRHYGESTAICPANWPQLWSKLRQQAGWRDGKKWPQDALRHTFASYHLSHFRSYAELQVEIGHRDAALLRTRYLDQRGVKSPRRFWMEE